MPPNLVTYVSQATCQLVGARQVSNVKVSPLSIVGSEEFKNTDQLLQLSNQLGRLKAQTQAFLASSSSLVGVQSSLQSFSKPQSQQVSSGGT